MFLRTTDMLEHNSRVRIRRFMLFYLPVLRCTAWLLCEALPWWWGESRLDNTGDLDVVLTGTFCDKDSDWLTHAYSVSMNVQKIHEIHKTRHETFCWWMDNKDGHTVSFKLLLQSGRMCHWAEIHRTNSGQVLLHRLNSFSPPYNYPERRCHTRSHGSHTQTGFTCTFRTANAEQLLKKHSNTGEQNRTPMNQQFFGCCFEA